MADNTNWASEQALRELIARTPDPQKFADTIAKALKDAGRGGDISAVASSIDANTRASADLTRGMSGLLGNNGRLSKVDEQMAMLGGEAGKSGGALGKFGRIIQLGGQLAMQGFNRVSALAEGVFDAYDVGVVFKGGLHEFNKAISDLGVDAATFQKIITKQSMVVQTLGTKRFVELGKSLQAATDYGTTLGMHSDEVVEYMGQYVDTLRITNSLQGMTNTQLVEGSKKYLTELNAVAQATGKRREQLIQEAKEMQKRPDWLALVATFPKEIRTNLQNATKEFLKFGTMGGKIQDMVADVLTRGGVQGIQDKATLQAVIQSGARDAVERYAAALKQGDVETADAAAAEIRQRLEKWGESLAPSQARLAGLSEAAGFAAKVVEQTAMQEQREAEGGPVAKDAADIVKTTAMVNRALEELNSQFNTAAIALTQDFLPGVQAAAAGAIAVSDGFDEMMKKLGLIDEQGGMTKTAANLAAATAAAGILGSVALFKVLMGKISPSLGANIAPMLERLGVKAPGVTTAGPNNATVATGASRMTVSRLLGGMLTGLAGINAAIEDYEQSGSVTEAGAVGAGTAAGVHYGGNLGARAGSMLGRKGELLGAIAGGMVGGVGGEALVKELFSMFDTDAPTPEAEMSPEQRTMSDQLRQGVEDANRVQEEQKNLLERMLDQLSALTDATTRQTSVLSSALDRSGQVIH